MKHMLIAALLLALTGRLDPAGAEQLGRLFFTPAQRAQLEQQLRNKPVAPAHTLKVNGIVQRHGAGRTIWINGVPEAAGRSDDDAPDSVPVAVAGQQQPVEVKVGQHLYLAPAEP